MDWYDFTGKAHERTFPYDGRLSSLPTDWERELAAIWRLEADVNNGAYLQFLGNWGRESYEYASQALKKIGALRMAAIVDACQALVDEHVTEVDLSYDELRAILPDDIDRRIDELSSEFIDYPDDIAELGMRHYEQHFTDNARWDVDPQVERTAPVWPPEVLARAAEADARITNHKCPHCGQPCPSYRKTCKHCRKTVNKG